MLNHIVIMGRLTRDPELRHTQTGTPVVSFTLAVDRDYGSRDGNDRQTDFIDVVAWRNTAEFVSKYFTKGRMAVASGRLQIRDWTDREGGKRRSAEVVAENVYFGDSKRPDSSPDAYAPAAPQGADGGFRPGRLFQSADQLPPGVTYDPGGTYDPRGYQSGGYQQGADGGSGYRTPVKSSDFASSDGDDELPF